MFAIPWSIAAVVDTDGRQKFDQYYRQLLRGDVPDCPVPKCLVGQLQFPPSDNALIYDFCWEVRLYVHIAINIPCHVSILVDLKTSSFRFRSQITSNSCISISLNISMCFFVLLVLFGLYVRLLIQLLGCHTTTTTSSAVADKVPDAINKLCSNWLRVTPCAINRR